MLFTVRWRGEPSCLRDHCCGAASLHLQAVFDTVVRPECVTCTSNPLPAVVPSEVFVGKAKESLDLVDAELSISGGYFTASKS